ncbi:MAG: hypothetical protein HY814_10545 [Candidatus Riflebacteria bacterium]|nr:hypothetical protein [Candidatus Riflebacteria bacterium]
MTSEFIQKKKIGEILMSKGLITQQQLETALRIQREDRSKRVGEIWVEAGIITEEVLARALAAQYNVQYFDLANFVPKEDLADLVRRPSTTSSTSISPTSFPKKTWPRWSAMTS